MSQDPYGYREEPKDEGLGNTPEKHVPTETDRVNPVYPAAPSNPPGYGSGSHGITAEHRENSEPSPYGQPHGFYQEAPQNVPYNQQGNNGYGASNPYGQPPHAYPANPNGQATDTWAEMKKPQNLSVIYGATSLLMLLLSSVLGFTFLITLVTAPLAIIEAKKARRQGQKGTLGAVLGWVSLGLIVLSILVIIVILVLGFAVMSTAYLGG